MKKIIPYSLAWLFTSLLFQGCEKKFDAPPYKPVSDGSKLSIVQVKERTTGLNSVYRFGDGDSNLYCTVTMDESSGNIYKQVFVQDQSGAALQLRLLNSGGLFTGDKIRINLNNQWLISANNMIYLDSVDIEKSVVKLSSGNQVQPKVTTISKILSYSSTPKDANSLQSQLVEINTVEFSFDERLKPFANAIGKTAYEYALTDCSGKEIPVRTSGMANFAAKLTPSGNGKIIALVQQYNTELSLVIRNFNEVQMNAVACVTAAPETFTGTTYLFNDFNDNSISSGGWVNMQAMGTTSWTTSNFAENTYYARISNKIGTSYEPCESWLISPPVDISGATDPVITFISANSSSLSPVHLMVSTNYTAGEPSTATWISLPFTYPSDYFKFVNSGFVSVQNYKSNKMRFAFKYSGTASSGSIWEIDNIVVRERN